MTQDEIIEMAREAGGYAPQKYPEEWRLDANDLERLAKLVAEREREACAKIADEWAVGWPHPSQVIAERIRERT